MTVSAHAAWLSRLVSAMCEEFPLYRWPGRKSFPAIAYVEVGSPDAKIGLAPGDCAPILVTMRRSTVNPA